MGYKVYAGTMNVITGYSAEWIKKQLIFSSDPLETDAVILSPKLTMDKNQIGSLEFTVPKRLLDTGTIVGERANPIYDSLEIKKTKVIVVEDDTILFMGYVKTITLNFDLSQSVVVEDLLGYLCMGQKFLRPRKHSAYNDNPGQSLYGAIMSLDLMTDKDDSPALSCPAWNTGTVNVAANVAHDTSDQGSSVDTIWNLLNTYFLDEYDGYLRSRFVENASKTQITWYIDYLSDIEDKTEQTVAFGVNMLDFQYEEDLPDDLVNYVQGDRYWSDTVTKGFWIFASTTTTNHYIGNHAQNDESIKKYGYHTRRIVNDTVTTESAMLNLCKQELAKYKQFIEPTITVKAFDLADTGVKTDHLGFLKKTRIISEPHNIDEWMVCTKAVLPLDQPDQKEFTYGRPPEKLTDQQAKSTTQGSHHDLSIRGLIRAANG